jgi:hypothetical protein
MKKEDIKELLEFGFKIEFPFKDKISSWYTNISISKYENYYDIYPYSIKFYDIDEAVNYFLDKAITSKNKGYIQGRLDKKYNFEEDYNLEKPDDELKKLFEDEGKIVDEEAKKFDISVKKFPKVKKAVEDFEIIIKNFDIDTISNDLLEYEKKYSMLNVYISNSFVYEPDGTIAHYTHKYRHSGNDITQENLEDHKSQKIDGYKFKNIEISFTMRGNDEYHSYEINV